MSSERITITVIITETSAITKPIGIQPITFIKVNGWMHHGEALVGLVDAAAVIALGVVSNGATT